MIGRLLPSSALVGILLLSSCSPGPPSPEAIVDAFVQRVQADDFTFHTVSTLEMDLTVGAQQQQFEVESDVDVSGEDAVGTVMIDIGPSITTDILVVDGQGYSENEGEWEEMQGFDEQPQAPMNPFAALDSADDVEYVEATEDGLHTLSTDIWLGADPESLEQTGWEDVELEVRSTEILVTEEGVPVRLTFQGDVTGVFQGQDADVTFDVAYEFSNVGEPVTIPDPNQPVDATAAPS